MNISEFNINAEFIACNHITTNELNPLVEKPYHTKASIFALCTKGVLKTIINHTQFRVEANTLLVIPPETFVQLLHTSDDAEIYVVIFSQQLIQSSGAGKVMMDKFHIRRRAAVSSQFCTKSIFFTRMNRTPSAQI